MPELSSFSPEKATTAITTIKAAPPLLAVAAFLCSMRNTLISSHGRRGFPPLAAGPAHLRRPGRSVTPVPAGDIPARATYSKPCYLIADKS